MLSAGDEPITGYRLEAFLGRGQFGEVWKCSAPGGGSAALKFLDLRGKVGWKEFRGTQRVKKMRHAHLMPITALWLLDEDRNIIDDDTVRELGEGDAALKDTMVPSKSPEPDREPRWLVVAQLLGDRTLGDELEAFQSMGEEGIPLEQLLVYLDEAAKGIDFLNSAQHDLGEGNHAVQHCDIKPANMLLVGGSVLVCDFGLAQILSGNDSRATATGMLGSPAYMAPECIAHRPSSTTDQYSLAISYYELRTGKLPFQDQTPLGVLEAHRSGNLDLSELPAAERQVIAKATSENPEDRFPSCLAMVRALRQASIAPEPAPRTPYPMGLVAAVCAVALLAIAIIAIVRRDTGPDPSRNNQPTKRFTIAVQPPTAELTVDGQPQSLSRGEVELERPSGDSLSIVVSGGPDYDVEARTIKLAELTEARVTVRLTPSARFIAGQAMQKLTEGDWQQALDRYAEAIEKDERFARYPEPNSLHAVGGEMRTGEVHQMQLSRGGDWLVVCDVKGIVQAWSLIDGKVSQTAREVHRHEFAVQAMAVGEGWVATADEDGQMAISPLEESAEPTVRLDLESLGVVKLAITKDDRFVVSGSDNQLRRWDLWSSNLTEQRARLLGRHQEMIGILRVEPNGDSVISGSYDKSVKQWLVDQGTQEGKTLATLGGDVYALAVCAPWVAMAGDESESEKRVRVARLDGGNPIALAPSHIAPVVELAFDLQGKWLAAGSEDDGELNIWQLVGEDDWQSLSVPHQHADTINDLAFDPSSQFLVSAGNDGRIILWDLQSQDRRSTLMDEYAYAAVGLAISGDGSWLFTANEDGSIRVWDLKKCLLIKRACDKQGVAPSSPNNKETGWEA